MVLSPSSQPRARCLWKRRSGAPCHWRSTAPPPSSPSRGRAGAKRHSRQGRPLHHQPMLGPPTPRTSRSSGPLRPSLGVARVISLLRRRLHPVGALPPRVKTPLCRFRWKRIHSASLASTTSRRSSSSMRSTSPPRAVGALPPRARIPALTPKTPWFTKRRFRSTSRTCKGCTASARGSTQQSWLKWPIATSTMPRPDTLAWCRSALSSSCRRPRTPGMLDDTRPPLSRSRTRARASPSMRWTTRSASISQITGARVEDIRRELGRRRRTCAASSPCSTHPSASPAGTTTRSSRTKLSSRRACSSSAPSQTTTSSRTGRNTRSVRSSPRRCPT